MANADLDPLKIAEDGMHAGRSVSRTRLCELFGVSPYTMLRWEHKGLQRMGTMVQGQVYYEWSEVYRFLSGRRTTTAPRINNAEAKERLRREGYKV